MSRCACIYSPPTALPCPQQKSSTNLSALNFVRVALSLSASRPSAPPFHFLAHPSIESCPAPAFLPSLAGWAYRRCPP